MTVNMNSPAYFNWTNQYGLSWTHGGQLTCDLNGDVYFNLYEKSYYSQQTGFTKIIINRIGIGIGTSTPSYPLHITTYASSTQTYKYLNYSGVGGPGTYTQNYSIYCSYANCASEFNAISAFHIKTNRNNLELGLNIIKQIIPVTYNFENKNKYGASIRYGLIAQEIKQ